MPKNGISFSLAYLIVIIFPSAPLAPNPPGTIIPSTPSSNLVPCSSMSSASIHLILTLTSLLTLACFKASFMLRYESVSLTYFPTMAISTVSFKALYLATIFSHSLRSGSLSSNFNLFIRYFPNPSLSRSRGTSYVSSTS
ncbi:139aa long hypothetical protein [Pyrococcus horikoshii OT3]|uniref:Uncharacterized protein n=1 Tax=Pyrococcus horikoshii (strain ATCC 700860 / DSM 12428 / JCM 9974 / NBRC 100139 / OT-3) TaxID=70601 RepID=O59457_PYRHO|nr:139aa long hypothetical protein [Pyrococcus horikoshii OT3]